jgi:hypothetical protein
MTWGKTMTAAAAQVTAQALTGWALLAHLAGWPDVSVWVVAFLVAAALVPFRHDGSRHDRAAANFGASLVVGGFLWWEVLSGGLRVITGNGGSVLGAEGMLMLAATVLFTVAGAMFWIVRGEDLGHGG